MSAWNWNFVESISSSPVLVLARFVELLCSDALEKSSLQLDVPTFSQMCADASISQHADHRVDVHARILNLFRQANVRCVDRIALCASAHEQVVWLDVSMDVPFRMNILEAMDELVREQQHGL
jgi:hypothetical protein